MSGWHTAMSLDENRQVIQGSTSSLRDAIARGADLRIYTEFRHNEHMEPGTDRSELVREVADFRVTYLLDNRWAAGIISLRQPVNIPYGFGPRPSMSFFLYNEDGNQAIARPYLDGAPVEAPTGPSPSVGPASMPRYHAATTWDGDTNAPSQNFVYDFDVYRFLVRDVWREVYAHDENGNRVAGSMDELVDAFATGCEVKIAVRDLCCDLSPEPLPHEVFVHLGSCYFYTEAKLFMACSHPVVRVRPDIPLSYTSNGWDFGWLMPRTDGFLAKMIYNPYTLMPARRESRCAMRWFVS